MTFDSKFTPDKWAAVSSEEKISNNSTGTFHAYFKEQFYTSHPTIFISNELYLAFTTFNYLN